MGNLQDHAASSLHGENRDGRGCPNRQVHPPNICGAQAVTDRAQQTAVQRAWANDRIFQFFHVGMLSLLASLAVSIVAAEILVGFLFVLWIVLMIRGVRYKRTPLDIPILLFILVRLTTIIFSEYPSLSWNAVTRELVYYVSYFFTVFYFQNSSDEKALNLVRMLLASTAVVTVVAISRYALGYVPKVNALTGGGMLSTQLALLMPVLFVAARERVAVPSRILVWTGVAIFGAGLAFSMTRGDWLATIAALVVFSFVLDRKMLIGIIAFVTILAVALPSVRHRMSTLQNPLENTSDRTTLWRNAAELAGSHPLLGFGPATFSAIFNDVGSLGDKHVAAWHNDFIQIYMESGGAGVLALAGMLSAAFVLAVRSVRSRIRVRNGFDSGWMGILVLLVYVVSGLFTMPTISITNAMLFRFLIAMVAVDYVRVREKRSAP